MGFLVLGVHVLEMHADETIPELPNTGHGIETRAQPVPHVGTGPEASATPFGGSQDMMVLDPKSEFFNYFSRDGVEEQ